MKDVNLIRVLVVDDESFICETLKDYLEDYGFKVTSASSGKEAMEILVREPQDVALIDMRLPAMNGDVLVLEAHRIQPGLRFLIHTGSSAYHISEELQRIGIGQDHVFFKPVRDLGRLKDAIESLFKEEEGDDTP